MFIIVGILVAIVIGLLIYNVQIHLTEIENACF